MSSNQVAIGDSALYNFTYSDLFQTLGQNVAVGSKALFASVSVAANTAVGYQALANNTSGSYNTALGNYALYENTNGIQNTAIGYNAQVTAGNINFATAIGAGAIASVSNSMVLGATGTQVCIGTSTPAKGYLLSVNGSIMSTAIQVELQNSWPDYVFDKDYKLMSISDLETSINSNKHLPNLPDACEVEAKGMNVGEMQTKIVEKLEEADLYIIQLQKFNLQLQAQMDELKAQMNALKK